MGRAFPKAISLRAKQAALTILMMTIFPALACAPAHAGAEDRRFVPTSRELQLAMLTPADAAQAGNQLGYDVFGQILRSKPAGENILISPYSLSAALSIVAEGADGATAAAFRQAMHRAGLPDDQIGAAQQSLQQSLTTLDPTVTLSIANALWGDRTVKFRPPFLAAAKETYAADVAAVD